MDDQSMLQSDYDPLAMSHMDNQADYSCMMDESEMSESPSNYDHNDNVDNYSSEGGQGATVYQRY